MAQSNTKKVLDEAIKEMDSANDHHPLELWDAFDTGAVKQVSALYMTLSSSQYKIIPRITVPLNDFVFRAKRKVGMANSNLG